MANFAVLLFCRLLDLRGSLVVGWFELAFMGLAGCWFDCAAVGLFFVGWWGWLGCVMLGVDRYGSK